MEHSFHLRRGSGTTAECTVRRDCSKLCCASALLSFLARKKLGRFAKMNVIALIPLYTSRRRAPIFTGCLRRPFCTTLFPCARILLLLSRNWPPNWARGFCVGARLGYVNCLLPLLSVGPVSHFVLSLFGAAFFIFSTHREFK